MIPVLRHRGRAAALFVLLLGTVILAAPVGAQIPDRFTNLKILPKDIAKEDLVRTMRDYSSALGVRCGFCHAHKTPDPRSEFDWAADSKPEKVTARVMIRMTQLINTEEIPKITTKDPDRVEVRCETCHRGQERPWLIQDVLTQAFNEGGLDSLEAHYKELRGKYYGSGTYDFSVAMLPALGERLAGPDKPEVAVQLAQLNVELFPDSGPAHLELGQALARAGQVDAAAAALKKAVELEPGLKGNADRILERLQRK